MQMLNRLFFPACLALALVAGYAFATSFGPKSPSGTLTVEAAPSGAAITIDGKKARVGKSTVPAGQHSVQATKDGFDKQVQIIAVKDGDSVEVGFILDPSAESTKDWYDKHPDDQKLAEGISSHVADYTSSANTKANSLLQLLPVSYSDGQGGSVSIDYGKPVGNSQEQGVYISTNNPEDRQDALTWIRNRGYDPATMDVVFYSESNPFDESGGE